MMTAEAAEASADVTSRLRRGGSVFAADEAALLVAEARDERQLRTWVTRRVAGEPVEHIVGWAEFLGHRITVAPGVFVPRRRTELMARAAIGMVSEGDVAVELCCGAAPVATAMAAAMPSARVYAGDIDERAVACARLSLERFGGRAAAGDLFDALPVHIRGAIAVLAVNAPYVPTAALATMPADARFHEPARALDGGIDGLDIHGRVAAGAAEWLAPGGSLLIELADHQLAEATEMLQRNGLTAELATDGELDTRVLIGRR